MDSEKKFFDSADWARKFRQTPLRNTQFWMQSKKSNLKSIDNSLFESLNDWHYFAILEMTYTEGFDSKPETIAKKLGITNEEAERAVTKLLNLDLLEFKDHQLRKKDPDLTTAKKQVTTPALKFNQKQFLAKAAESLEKDAIEKRSVTSITVPTNSAKSPS